MVKLTSRITQIIATATARVEQANKATSERIAESARATVRARSYETGELHDSIEATEDGVVVGAAHGPYVEFGTVDTPAEPFLVPAAEAERAAHVAAVGAAYRGP